MRGLQEPRPGEASCPRTGGQGHRLAPGGRDWPVGVPEGNAIRLRCDAAGPAERGQAWGGPLLPSGRTSSKNSPDGFGAWRLGTAAPEISRPTRHAV